MAETTPSLWKGEQKRVLKRKATLTSLTATTPETRKTRRYVTSLDISNNPDDKAKNPTERISGVPVRSARFGQPGNVPLFETPEGGGFRFLNKASRNFKEKAIDWHVEGFDAIDRPIGAGTVTTRWVRGTIITTKKGPTEVFRPQDIVY